MLVLQREENESIIVTVPPSKEPVRVTFTVLGIRGTRRVRAGVDAPVSCDVHRGEVQDAIDAAGAAGKVAVVKGGGR